MSAQKEKKDNSILGLAALITASAMLMVGLIIKIVQLFSS